MAKKPKNTVSSQQPMFDGWDDDPNQAPPEYGSDAGITSAIKPDNAISLTSEYSATAETTSPYPGTEKVSQVTISAAPVDPAERYQMPDLTDQLVIVVDSHSLIYQVFHALPPMTSPQGEPVGALHGFLGDVIELVNRFQPKHLFCAFDKSETTFRNDLYPEYKSHRDPMPEELRQQLPVIHEVLPAFGTCVLELGGFEADDILATLAAKVEAAGGRCLLVTSDKDCRQLITDRVQIYNIRKHETFGKQELMDTWGITPEQVVDFQTLVGDSVDNIPGVPLIGPKLAQELLSKYQNLENVFANAHEVAGPKRRQNLIDGRQQAIVSRQLVELRKDVPCEFDWYASRPSSCDLQRIEQLCQRWGFRRLRERATEILGRHATQALPAKVEIPWDLQYPLVRRREELQILADACRKAKRIAIDTETTSTSPRGSDLVGISIAWAEGKATYIPWLGPPGSELVDRDAFHELLAPVLADPAIEKVGQNIKFDLIVLRTAGIDVRGVTFDTMVADYLLDPGQRNHSLDEMSKRYLGHEMIPIERLIGTAAIKRK